MHIHASPHEGPGANANGRATARRGDVRSQGSEGPHEVAYGPFFHAPIPVDQVLSTHGGQGGSEETACGASISKKKLPLARRESPSASDHRDDIALSLEINTQLDERSRQITRILAIESISNDARAMSERSHEQRAVGDGL